MSTYITLYITFLKIGSFAFGGGYAVLPLIKRYVVDDMHWLNMDELTNLISLSQITPGPIGINSATFIGTKVGFIPGAIIATIAEVTPCFILMMILGRFLFSGKKFQFMDKILKGLKPAISGLILIAAINLTTSSLFTKTGVSIPALIGFVVGGVLFIKKIDIIKIILLTSSIGIILHILI